MNIHCGEKLQAAMALRGCSGVELSKKLGVYPQQISRWRKQRELKVKTILALCDALEMEITDFLK